MTFFRQAEHPPAAVFSLRQGGPFLSVITGFLLAVPDLRLPRDHYSKTIVPRGDNLGGIIAGGDHIFCYEADCTDYGTPIDVTVYKIAGEQLPINSAYLSRKK